MSDKSLSEKIEKIMEQMKKNHPVPSAQTMQQKVAVDQAKMIEYIKQYGYPSLNFPYTRPAPIELHKVLTPEETTKELYGFRFWHIIPAVGHEGEPEVYLRSPVQRTIWNGPTLHAYTMPSLDSGNGIHAYNTQQSTSIGGMIIGFNLNRINLPIAFGVVALSGLIIQGARGYRAEIATIQCLSLCGGFDDSIPDITLTGLLSERYQCDVERVVVPTVPTRFLA